MSSEPYTAEELLFDLDERIDRAVDLLRFENRFGQVGDEMRRNGKIEGLLVVKDWLRGYNV